MNNNTYNPNKWLVESCPICDSVNHIFLSNIDAHAWECWHCLNMWWYDKDLFMTTYNYSDEESNELLCNNNPLICVLYGQQEEYNEA